MQWLMKWEDLINMERWEFLPSAPAALGFSSAPIYHPRHCARSSGKNFCTISRRSQTRISGLGQGPGALPRLGCRLGWGLVLGVGWADLHALALEQEAPKLCLEKGDSGSEDCSWRHIRGVECKSEGVKTGASGGQGLDLYFPQRAHRATGSPKGKISRCLT